MKEKKSIMLKIGVGASLLGLFVGSVAGPTIVKIKNNMDIEKWTEYDENVIGEYMPYFGITEKGLAEKLILDDNPIPIVLGSMSEQSRQYVVDGINALDIVSDKINYTIYDAKDFEKKNGVRYICIEMCDSIADHLGGRTSYKIDNYSGEILMPIKIQIDKMYEDAYFDESYTQSVLTTIVQHELLHTLGFKDIYDLEQRNNTIMYYNLTSNSPRTLTQRDIDIISQVYDGKKSADKTPSSESIVPTSYYYDAKNNVVNYIRAKHSATDTKKQQTTGLKSKDEEKER